MCWCSPRPKRRGFKKLSIKLTKTDQAMNKTAMVVVALEKASRRGGIKTKATGNRTTADELRPRPDG